MHFLTVIAAISVLLCLLVSYVYALEDAERLPNFIFMFADDLGFGDLKSYGHPYASTDNLDRLANEGTAFQYFHVTGNVCPTSRAGFMTSRYPAWFPNYTPDYGFMGALTVTKILQDSGYVTGHIGKWNIGQPEPSKSDEMYEPYGISHLRITNDGRDDPRGKEGERYDLAIEFVEQYKDVPFYLNVWMYAVHSPIEPPDYLIEKFDGLVVDRTLFGEHMQKTFDRIRSVGGDINDAMKVYLGEVYGMDMQIGRLLTRLDELGLSNNTVVMFSSDNGPAKIDNRNEVIEGSAYAGGLRGGKHSFYEGGIRVPFLVRWPGHIPAGKINTESFISALDWLPTVASLAGADVPWDLVEGEDVSDIWFGSDRSRKNPTFYQEPGSGSEKVHYNGWKLYSSELYNLKDDRDEFVNVYDDNPEIVAGLKDLKQQYREIIPGQHRFGGRNPLPFDPLQPVRNWTIPQVLVDPTTSPSFSPTSVPSTIPTSSPSSSISSEPSLKPMIEIDPSPSPTLRATVAQPSVSSVSSENPTSSSSFRGPSWHSGLFFWLLTVYSLAFLF